MKKKISLFIIFMLIGAGLIVLYRDNQTRNAPAGDATTQVDLKTFESDLGISFKYPSTYYLMTQELGDGHRGNLVIVLVEDTEENRLVREGKTPPREGPTAITFGLFQSPDNLDPRLWITKNALSNYHLGDGVMNEITIFGKPALSYRWSGLYEGESIVFTNRDYIVFASVTYLTPEDRIRDDFSHILETIVLN